MSVVHTLKPICQKCEGISFLEYIGRETYSDGSVCDVYRCPKCGYEEKVCIKIEYSFNG